MNDFKGVLLDFLAMEHKGKSPSALEMAHLVDIWMRHRAPHDLVPLYELWELLKLEVNCLHLITHVPPQDEENYLVAGGWDE